nr:hypothetical protein [Salmonella enterica]
MKWVALILMIGDHINKYLLNDTIPFYIMPDVL